jgi:hypothetical protein
VRTSLLTTIDHNRKETMPTLAGAEVTTAQVRGTIKLLDYYRRFLKSECGRCVDAEDRHRTGSTMTKEQVRRRLSFLVLTAINRKAGIPDPDNDIELWRDCQLVQHLVHRNNPSGLVWRWHNMRKFRTRWIQKRYGYLLREGDDE